MVDRQPLPDWSDIIAKKDAEITRLTAENEALANDRDGYVQLLTDQNNALIARVRELEDFPRDLEDYAQRVLYRAENPREREES